MEIDNTLNKYNDNLSNYILSYSRPTLKDIDEINKFVNGTPDIFISYNKRFYCNMKIIKSKTSGYPLDNSIKQNVKINIMPLSPIIGYDDTKKPTKNAKQSSQFDLNNSPTDIYVDPNEIKLYLNVGDNRYVKINNFDTLPIIWNCEGQLLYELKFVDVREAKKLNPKYTYIYEYYNSKIHRHKLQYVNVSFVLNHSQYLYSYECFRNAVAKYENFSPYVVQPETTTKINPGYNKFAMSKKKTVESNSKILDSLFK